MIDYGEFTPEPPSAEAFAIRDKLAEELAAADAPARRDAAEKRLVGHMLTVGLPLEDFSTSRGQAFVVNVSVSKPRAKPGRERDARKWLDAQKGSARTLAHKLLDRGGGLPPDLFDVLDPSVHIEPA